MKIKFSVSMPVHNAAKYLEEAIRSVLAQDDPNFELILVDDHSTDESLAICESWREKAPEKIRVFQSPYKGSLWARRECIHHSAGDFLYIMDADDTLCDRHALSLWAETIRKTGCDLILFNETETPPAVFRNTPDGAVLEGEALLTLYEDILSMGDLNPLWNKAFSRSLIDPDDTPYLEHLWLSHGTDFFQSVAITSAAKRAVYLNKKLYEYRETPGSITHRYNPEMFRSALALIDRRREFARTWNPQPADLERKLDICALNEFCTVLNKLRKTDLSFEMKKEVYDSIRSNEAFRRAYLQRAGLPVAKRAVVTLLFHRQFGLLDRLLNIR